MTAGLAFVLTGIGLLLGGSLCGGIVAIVCGAVLFVNS